MSASIEAIYNYRQADDRVATSGQPDEAELAGIAAAGYTVVINLALHDDPRYSLADEAGTVSALGMIYVHIPVQFTSPTREDLYAFFAAMERHRDAMVWVHCAANKRVSTFVGLYRRLRQGWPQSEAFALQHEVWQPNEIWAHFISTILGDAGEA